MAGLTATGIEIKDVAEVLSDIEAEQIANIDPYLNLGPDDVLGQLNGVVAAAIAETWELLEEIYHSAYPDTASGQSLSYVSALTGSIRQAATKMEITGVIFGVVGTNIPAGTQFYVDTDPASVFETDSLATIAEEGAADFILVPMTAVNAGTATTAAQSDNLILTGAISGVTSAGVSAVVAEPSDEETDEELRLRREQSLALAGSSTVEAIRADMLTVTGVDNCTVFENPTSITDANGVPPYAIEVLVHSSAAPSYTAQDVADQIWASKPAGTETYGGEGPETVTDSLGNDHANIYYSEPDAIRLYVAITLTAATDGTYITDAEVAAAVAAWADATLTVGQSVYASDLINVVADLTGVVSVDVSNVFVEAGDATPDTVEWIAAARELGTIDGDNDVTVNS